MEGIVVPKDVVHVEAHQVPGLTHRQSGSWREGDLEALECRPARVGVDGCQLGVGPHKGAAAVSVRIAVGHSPAPCEQLDVLEHGGTLSLVRVVFAYAYIRGRRTHISITLTIRHLADQRESRWGVVVVVNIYGKTAAGRGYRCRGSSLGRPRSRRVVLGP